MEKGKAEEQQVRWEYQTTSAQLPEELVTRANALGQQGWEMVSCIVHPNGTSWNSTVTIAYFKRPVT